MGGGQQLPIHSLTAPPSFASSDSTDNTNLDLATAHLWVRDTIHSIAEHVKQLSTMKWDPAALQPSDIDDGDDVVVRDLAGLVGAVQYAQPTVGEHEGTVTQCGQPDKWGNISIDIYNPSPNHPLSLGKPLYIFRLRPWSPQFLSKLQDLVSDPPGGMFSGAFFPSVRERIPSDGPIEEDFLKAGQTVGEEGKRFIQIGKNDKVSLQIKCMGEPEKVRTSDEVDVSSGWGCKHCEEKVKTVEMLEFVKRDLQTELRVKDRELEAKDKDMKTMERDRDMWEECHDGEEKDKASGAEQVGGTRMQDVQTGQPRYEQTLKAKAQELKVREKKLRETNQELKARMNKLKETSQAIEARKEHLEAREGQLEEGKQELETGHETSEANRRNLKADKEIQEMYEIMEGMKKRMEVEEGSLNVKGAVMGLEKGERRGEQRREICMNEFFAVKGLKRC